MTLADFTSPSLIIPSLSGRDVPGVIQELSQAFQREGRVPDLLAFYNAVLNREFLASTSMEAAMAFPHARLSSVKELSFALGCSSEPLAWGTRAVHSVRLVFLIAVPATESMQYLHLISGLAQLSKKPLLLERLFAAQDRVQIMDLLQQIALRKSAARNGGNGLGPT